MEVLSKFFQVNSKIFFCSSNANFTIVLGLWSFPHCYSQRFLMLSHIFLVSAEPPPKEIYGTISEVQQWFRAQENFKVS